MIEGAPRTRYCSRCLTTFASDEDRCSNLSCRSARPAQGWGELLEAGELIDRTYRVHHRLAIGGAGVTYLTREVGADDAETGPLLAVKMLYQQRDQGPYLRRLATEAQILQGLNHPQIVECRGFVHRSGHSPYLVTRFEAGGSLLDHIRRVGVLPPTIAAAVAMQVCDALAVAHRQGVIHRDLKPENVLIEAEVDRDTAPAIRVADFGIAKVFGGVGDRLTRVGAFIGTPQYAAPEQFEGMAPEPATDVYAVGALLYFCLTARPVADFMAELDPESQRDHLLAHLPPRLVGVEGPERPWLDETLAAAMTPDPGDRIAIDLLAERLHQISLGRDPGRITILGGQGDFGASRTLTLPPEALEPVPTGSITSHSGKHPRVTTNPKVTPSKTAPSVSLQPTPTIERITSSSAAQTGMGCAAGGLLVGGGALVLALAAWMFWPDPVTQLTGKEADPVRVADWQSVAYALGQAGVAAEKVCKAPPYLAIEVVVESDGTLREAALLNYPHEPTRQCIERELKRTRYPRKGTDVVRVAATMVR